MRCLTWVRPAAGNGFGSAECASKIAVVLGILSQFACGTAPITDSAALPEVTSLQAPIPTTLSNAPRGLLQAYIAARKAEGRTQTIWRIREQHGALTAAGGSALDSSFDSAGVALRTRGISGRLDTRSVHCDGEAISRTSPQPERDPMFPNRVTSTHHVGLSEWWDNGPLGLEHGFDLDLPQCQDELVFELATPGFIATQIGREIQLTSQSDESVVLRYGEAFAEDSAGRSLKAEVIAPSPDSIRIVVQVVAAAWPVVVDPIVYAENTKLEATDKASGDYFGESVSIAVDSSGNITALVGARRDDVGANVDQGSAYVFVRSSGSTTWTQQTRLTASDGQNEDYFGHSVSLAIDSTGKATALVGAPSDALGTRDMVGTNWAYGSAYVFVRNSGATVWSQQTQLKASDGASYEYFGDSVSLAVDGSGNAVALVGAYDHRVGGNAYQGAAYVFIRNSGATVWSQQTILAASDGAYGDNFGHGVSVAFNSSNAATALVGSPNDDVGAAVNQGSAYAFVRSGTTWSQQYQFVNPGTAGQFGYRVSIGMDSTNTIALVGAYGDTSSRGAAHVFVRSGTTWSYQQKIVASDGVGGDGFGWSVSVGFDNSGTPTALVGTYGDDVGTNANQGSAYVFTRSGTVWSQQSILTASVGAANMYFGYSVALSKGGLLIGANGATSNQGAAYFFLPASPPSSLNYTTLTATYLVGNIITNNTPTINDGGATVSYSVSPALPAGLNLNTTTGVISGTPTTVTATTTYTITATNSAGSTTKPLSITVNASPPSLLNYTASTATYSVGNAITNNTPTINDGGATVTYSVSPALPAGLNLNTTTGVISGTPTTVAATATYTVTATNSAGSTTKPLSITVNASPPSLFGYTTSTATYLVGNAITNNTPTINNGGATVTYSVSPALPAGLDLNTTTGVISGTPTTVTATATYTITATNSAGSTTKPLSITVNASLPSLLNYTASTATYSVGNAITNNTPTINNGGATVTYSVSPALPAGLNLNTTTGVISGTPTTVAATATYTVTATNSAGSTTEPLSITVNASPPSLFGYTTSTATYLVGNAITNNTPTINNGGATVTYSVSPALPAGLNLNTTTGVISGTPTIVAATAIYTVTATNSAGSTTEPLSITVNASPPSLFGYTTSTATYLVGNAITNNTPTINDGGATVTYSVSPALPAGLNLNTTTGVISGTPTTVAATATYTVTATNSAGSTTKPLSITVNASLPSLLNYTASTATYSVGNAITNNTPTINNGGATVTYSVSPALPAGLNLNTTTGVISGTPTTVAATATYTVTATNSAGSTTEPLSITVNASPPSLFSYTTSTATYLVGNAITNNTPTINNGGATVTYSVSPALPAGLNLNTTTGVISGTPTTVAATATYTVTATNSAGSTTEPLSITVNASPPSLLGYTTSTATYLVGNAITNNTPTINDGGATVTYSVSPALPAGLNLNTTTGVISGTPTTVAATATYTVTATNSAGSTTEPLSITVNASLPSLLNYTASTATYSVGNAITDNTPTINDGGATVTYSVSPALPAGLNLNTTTGVISGTPTTVAATATYTVTATNSAGSTTEPLSITVNASPPSLLVYTTSTATYLVGNAITNNTPTINNGGATVTYSVSPALPAGLNLNTTTGVISGTPTTVTATATYTITATNIAGSTTGESQPSRQIRAHRHR